MRFIVLTISLFLVAACAQTTATQGTSFVDPGWNGAPARSIFVEVQNAPLNERTAIENKVVETLGKNGVRAMPSHALFLPTRDYGMQQRQDMLKGSDYETHLIIRPIDKDIETHYTPPEPAPFGTFGYGSHGWSSGVGVGFGINSGLYREEPIVTYNARLSIIKQDKTIWTGDFATRGASGMDFTQVGKWFGQAIVDRLTADGLI